jgi:hypothetical protein
MILPDKIIKVEESLLYKAIKYYQNAKKFNITTKEDINLLTILYAIGYINYTKIQIIDSSGGLNYEIDIAKIK